MADPHEDLVKPRPDPGPVREGLVVALLLLVSAAVRAYIVHFTYCVSKDSVGHMALAQFLRERDFASFFENVQHHFYPMVLFAAQDLLGTGLLAAQGLNVALGALAVVPLYLLGRDVFGSRSAMAACLFYAFQVLLARSAAMVATEPLYLLAFLSALYAGKKAMDAGSAFVSALAGFLLGVAFLVRPEGIVLWAVLVGWAVLFGLLKTASTVILRRPHLPSGPRLLGGALVMAVVFCLTIMPQVMESRLVGGEWQLTRKHSFTELARGEEVVSPSKQVPPSRHTFSGELRHLCRSALEMLEEAGWGYHLGSLLPVFYVLGVFCRKSQPREGRGELLLALVWVAYLAAAFRFRTVHGYVAERHLISGAAVALLWAGAGFLAMGRYIARFIARWDRLDRAPTRVTAVALMLLALGAMSLETLRFIAPEKAYMRTLGEAIRTEFPPKGSAAPRILSTGDPRLAFYAGGIQVDPLLWMGRFKKSPEETCRIVMEYGNMKRADLVLLFPGEPGSPDADILRVLEREKIPVGLSLDSEGREFHGKILVYRFSDFMKLAAILGPRQR